MRKSGNTFAARCGGHCLIPFLCVAGAGPVQSQIQPNRTVPPAAPVKPSLEFSAHPTPQEFFQARVFEEPLVPVGGEPTAAENADLARALRGYASRSGPDDFSALTGFLTLHPQSPWAAALLTDLGFEYYNTAHYSLALDAWRLASEAGKGASD